MSWLKLEPVRLYSIAAAVAALVVHFVPDFPSAAVLAVVAAVLGTGQLVRSEVWPRTKVEP